MTENKKGLLCRLLQQRKDLEALNIIKENPELCDNQIICLALDKRCFKTIDYLRALDLITLEGREERERLRLEQIRHHLAEFDKLYQDIEIQLKKHVRRQESGNHKL